jgi:hypothetical protein
MQAGATPRDIGVDRQDPSGELRHHRIVEIDRALTFTLFALATTPRIIGFLPQKFLEISEVSSDRTLWASGKHTASYQAAATRFFNSTISMEALRAERRDRDDGWLIADQVGDEPPCHRTSGEADMSMSEGMEKPIDPLGRPDDRATIRR